MGGVWNRQPASSPPAASAHITRWFPFYLPKINQEFSLRVISKGSAPKDSSTEDNWAPYWKKKNQVEDLLPPVNSKNMKLLPLWLGKWPKRRIWREWKIGIFQHNGQIPVFSHSGRPSFTRYALNTNAPGLLQVHISEQNKDPDLKEF